MGRGFEPRMRGGDDDLKMLRNGLTTGLALGVQVGTKTRGGVMLGENSSGLSMGFGVGVEVGLFGDEVLGVWDLF